MLATLVRRCHGDLDLAQDACQDVYESAIVAWGRSGIPDVPAVWLRTAGVAQGHRPGAVLTTSARTRGRLAALEVGGRSRVREPVDDSRRPAEADLLLLSSRTRP